MTSRVLGSSSDGDGDLCRRVAAAMEQIGGFSEVDVPLGPMTTYRVGGAAALFSTPRTVADLELVSDVSSAFALPVLTVGRGSNMLVADAGFAGIALTLAAMCSDVSVVGHDVISGAAVALPVLARRTVAASLTGFEWAVGVPGSVGGGVKMNAGGHGSDMSAVVETVDLFDLETASRTQAEGATLGLRFRASDLLDHQIVLGARLRLADGDREASERELEAIVKWRRENQPGGQNAGSVFVNPVPGEVTSGQLIDKAGLRGFRVGTAQVSEKHANFIQADEGGSATDVHLVIEQVRSRVAELSGYRLRTELRLVGFDSASSVAGQ